MADVKMSDDLAKRLEKAKKARQKLDTAKKRAEEKKEAVAKAKKAVKEAEKAQKKAEKEAKELSDERDVLVNLAGYKVESATTRKAIGGFYLYSLLHKFDSSADGKIVKNGEFKKKLDGVMADAIGKAVLACSAYYSDSDTIRIDGKKLRAEIDKYLKKKEDDVKVAKKLLDEECKKSVLPADEAEEKKEEQGETK